MTFFRKHNDYKFSRSQQFFFCTHDLVNFFEKCSLLQWILMKRFAAKNVDNVFYVLSRRKMWFEKCDSDFFVQRFFVTIRSCDFVWTSYRQYFWLLNLDSASDAYSFSTRRVTYACSRFVERRMCSLMRRLRRSHLIKLRTIYHVRAIQKRLR
jgi:hypothetical protein